MLARFGDVRAPRARRGVAVRLPGGEADLAEVVRALDAEGIAVAHLQLHQPTLDDVFLAKTGRTLEGAATTRRREARRRASAGEAAAAGVSRARVARRRSASSRGARSCARCASRR